MSDRPPFNVVNALSVISNLTHGFFGRRGGVSQGIHASLNCAFSAAEDQRENVEENRRRITAAMGEEMQLQTLSQVHSAKVVTLNAPMAQPVEADAMVTNTSGLLLGILTADCGPVLLADVEQRVIGAAHAGWKGAAGGVLEATVKAMEALGARRETIIAAVGPCIGQDSYEVGDGFRQHFLQQDVDNYTFFIASGREKRFQFDLRHFIGKRLEDAGIGHVTHVVEDTYVDAEQWFSYRRSCHRKEADYGRQVSVIGLNRK